MRNLRQPQHLAFKGWWVDGPEIRVLARLVVGTTFKTEQEVGPNLTMIMSADCLLDDDICEAAASAQHRQEKRDAFQRMVVEGHQPPLF